MMRETPMTAVSAAVDDPVANTWKWKRARCVGVAVEFWPTAWGFRAHRSDDYWGGERGVQVGPLVFIFKYNPMDGVFGFRCENDIPD